MTDYDSFILEKARRSKAHGFEPYPITAPLFDWQAAVVRWAIRQGRAALFEDCGLGKTLQQLEWAYQVSRHTGGAVLILTPLAVAFQTEQEASRFRIPAKVVGSSKECAGQGVWITNYEKLDHFDPGDFVGVVLDESSILKAFTGKTRQRLTSAFAMTPYRLCCTATPSPNDYTEFGQHADFLGVCTPAQMLATYFINDTFNTGDWRLKRHAEGEFWAWLASWAACVSKPSDIGFKDKGYILPALNMETIVVPVDETTGAADGDLFRHATLSATTMYKEMRATSPARVAAVAELVNESSEPWLVWCNTNDESEQLKAALPGCVEVKGSDSSEFKEMAIRWFKGELCSCETGKFRYKFPPCQTQNTSSNITDSTEIKNCHSQDNGSQTIRSEGSSTCANTPRPIDPSSKELLSNKKSTIVEGENNTRSAKRQGKKPKQKLKNGKVATQINERHSALKSSESPWMNSDPCTIGAEDNAKSADLKTTETSDFSRSSITAIQPASLGGCCAQSAILESGNSGTVSKHCGAPFPISRPRVLVSKSSIFGFGLNLQHCRNVAFVGLSYSFEDFYQALRRSYRFGQTKEVNAYIVQATTEGPIMQAIKRKIEQHQEMQSRMKQASAHFQNH